MNRIFKSTELLSFSRNWEAFISDHLTYYKKCFSSGSSIHMNNAGLAPISSHARDRVIYWANRFYQDGFYSDSDYMSEVVETRADLASLVGCDQGEIAFFQSTAGAISQLCFNLPLNEGDEVLTWDQEYSSHLYPWQEACRRKKAILVTATSGKDYSTPLSALIEKVTTRTKVIAVSWLQFQTGARTDLKQLGSFCGENNIFLFVDVMQGLGLHPFHMKALGVDAVAGGSHKWLTSPVGVGFLAIASKHLPLIRPHNVGASTFGTCDDPSDQFCEPKKDATKFEAGSKQVLEITALGASIKLLSEIGVEAIEAEVLRLSQMLKIGIQAKGYRVFQENSSIVNFKPRSDSAAKLSKICNFALRGPGIRLSPHAFNTDEEIEKIIMSL
jgi:cysteine desulfurase/selenocysteine lyase